MLPRIRRLILWVFWRRLVFPNIEGTIKTPRVPLDFSGYDPMPIGPPQVGEHSVEILREVGFSEEDVTVLMKKKIVGA